MSSKIIIKESETRGQNNSKIHLKQKQSRTPGLLTIALIALIFGLLGGGLSQEVVVPYVLKKLGKTESININKTESVTVKETSETIDAVKKITPSVVSITATKNVFSFFGGATQEKGGGTGFILTSDGYIVTNKHVVSDEKAKYTVITSDGKSYEAKITATDPFNDLAVIKIDAKNLTVSEIGDSDSLEVGQSVIAIGNALGLSESTLTVTRGVISAKGRAIQAGDSSGQSAETLENLLQTDAAINPGNSGGPLINLKGQVIGVNVAKADAENIGFAININTIKPIDKFIENLKESGKIVRPMIGVSYVMLTPAIATLNELSEKEGAWIVASDASQTAVLKDGPADKAGIEEDDIIVEFDGEKIKVGSSLTTLIQKKQPGDEVEVKVIRDGKEKSFKVTLGEYGK